MVADEQNIASGFNLISFLGHVLLIRPVHGAEINEWGSDLSPAQHLYGILWKNISDHYIKINRIIVQSIFLTVEQFFAAVIWYAYACICCHYPFQTDRYLRV